MPVTLKSRLPEIIHRLDDRAERVALEVAQRVATQAADRVSVESGSLRDSIEARPHDDGAAIYALFYWFFVEFGTVKLPPRPFMLPSLEHAKIADVQAEGRRLFASL